MSTQREGSPPALLPNLPQPLRQELFGTGEDGTGGLVSEVLKDVLRNLDPATRAPLRQPQPQRVLQQALAQGLAAALRHWQPPSAETGELDLLRDWLMERAVSRQLLHLVQPGSPSQLDVPEVRGAMSAIGLSTEQLGQPDCEALLRELATAFYRSITEQPDLREVIPLPPLRHVAEWLGAQLEPPSLRAELEAQLKHTEASPHFTSEKTKSLPKNRLSQNEFGKALHE